jgi:single-stranded DNA-binding protein
MARNNHVWVKGDITGDIYYDIFRLDGKEVQYLRLYMMIKGVKGASGVKGLRTCVYGPLAELVYGHVRKGSRIGVIGHIQQRRTRQGKMVFEIVASEVEFLRNIEWDAGDRVRRDLVKRGLLRPSYKDEDKGGGGSSDSSDAEEQPTVAIPEDLLDDE